MSFKLFKPHEDIDIQMVRIKKPFRMAGKSYVFEIFFGKENHQIFLQTPLCMAPYGYFMTHSQDNPCAFVIDLVLNDEGYLRMVSGLLRHVYDKLMSCVPATVNGKKYVSPVKEGTVRLRNANIDDVKVFDEKGESIALSHIHKNDKVYAIFQLEKVVVFSDVICPILKVLQLKRQGTPSVPACLFTSPPPKLPDKYQKMLDMGVPMPAVQQRMKMDGVVHGGAQQPPPLLKKVSLQLLPTLPPPEKKQPERHRVPSLDEIVSALRNLKTVGK